MSDSFSERDAGRTGSFKWDARKLNGNRIKKFDHATAMRIKLRLVALVQKVQTHARENAPWQDYGGYKKDGSVKNEHPSDAYPGRIAREQLYAGVLGGGRRKSAGSSERFNTSMLSLVLFHDQRTIYHGANESFRYGISLEGGVKDGHGPKQARPIIMPTLELFADEFMGACANALNAEQGDVPDHINK